jgi:hypothetical protein
MQDFFVIWLHVFVFRGKILNVEDLVMKKIKNLDDVTLHVSVTMATQESGKVVSNQS